MAPDRGSSDTDQAANRRGLAGALDEHLPDLAGQLIGGVAAKAAETKRGGVTDDLGKEVEHLVAAGGDGTLSAVAKSLAGSEKTLGLLPLGTLKHFAIELGMPLDLRGGRLSVYL
ncbi:putative lipid kinase [Thiorhodovibrio winogradskyi]|uniref:Lipid kinase n=1 Tax=Thiorhodovibrio winogradskyi TaxID=77007 RepID=A0ABZ0S637_9GAMM|nr:diacylglycerol kinase family protein [Thiorhodovibrio winogradskyi]